MQDRTSFKMSATIDQRQPIPKRQRCSFPKFDARALAHHPLSIGGVQKYLRIETLGPFDHRRIKMWMRDCDGADTAARVDFRGGLVVDERNAIPEQISHRRLQ